MTKKNVTVEAGRLDILGGGVCLTDARNLMEKALLKYGNKATIYLQSEPYDDGHYLAIYKDRLETDQEYEARLERESRHKQAMEQHERVLFERLKVKFGETK